MRKVFSDANRESASRKSAAARSRRPYRADPVTCQPDYDEDTWEFIAAVERYRETTGRRFPALSEVFGVMKGLGYSRAASAPPDRTPPPIARRKGPPPGRRAPRPPIRKGA